MKDKRLDVGKYDFSNDSIKTEGTIYAGDLFREFACSLPAMVGQVLRIDKKENGIVTITRLREYEE